MDSVDRISVEKMLTEIGSMFDELLRGPVFLITNDSMGDLVRSYWSDLIAAWRAHDENELMGMLRNDLPAFRAAWLKSAAGNALIFQGTSRPVATESATHSAREQCQKKKERRPQLRSR